MALHGQLWTNTWSTFLRLYLITKYLGMKKRFFPRANFFCVKKVTYVYPSKYDIIHVWLKDLVILCHFHINILSIMKITMNLKSKYLGCKCFRTDFTRKCVSIKQAKVKKMRHFKGCYKWDLSLLNLALFFQAITNYDWLR